MRPSVTLFTATALAGLLAWSHTAHSQSRNIDTCAYQRCDSTSGSSSSNSAPGMPAPAALGLSIIDAFTRSDRERRQQEEALEEQKARAAAERNAIKLNAQQQRSASRSAAQKAKLEADALNEARRVQAQRSATRGNQSASRCPAGDSGCTKDNIGEKLQERFKEGVGDVGPKLRLKQRIKGFGSMVKDCVECAKDGLGDLYDNARENIGLRK